MRGGEQLLELTPSQKKTVRHQFDSFCRKVLREEARDYERHIAWRSNHEVSLSELSEEQERQMYVLDEYPSEQTHFHVQGYDVAIENEDLANALTVLPDDKRDIVLLAFFLDMTDQEIADKLFRLTTPSGRVLTCHMIGISVTLHLPMHPLAKEEDISPQEKDGIASM